VPQLVGHAATQDIGETAVPVRRHCDEVAILTLRAGSYLLGRIPTSEDGLGLVPILLLVHLQKAGHKPIALLGGATGMVGDPSGKSEERNLLDEDTLNHNLRGVKAQLEKFLDFDPVLPNSAEMVNNYDWFKDMSFLSFIRDVGKYITVNYMSAKDSVRKRLDGENGMSFTEFTYQLVQGYDFYWLYQNKGCKLQMGGSDQWGNITAGIDLTRKKLSRTVHGLTLLLITKSDGTKFGKTESGTVWLDARRTSVYKFYQFWIHTDDRDVIRFLYLHEFCHWWLYLTHGWGGSAEIACDRYAYANYRRRGIVRPPALRTPGQRAA